ncbi:MAG: hypothetical protein GC181_07170 [Bacteroidetes bacterium]|nr:hypothetical protein [Bacteroidota bacterium]
MKIKKYTGNLVTIDLKNRKTPVSGYVIDQNDDWTLLKNNPVDFVIDGYVLIPNKYIKNIHHGKEEKWAESVMNIKGLQPKEEDRMALNGLESILTAITEKYHAFMLNTKSDDLCFPGRLKSIGEKELVLEALSSKAEWEGEFVLKINEIRSVEFNTDYLNSLMLVNRVHRVVE